MSLPTFHGREAPVAVSTAPRPRPGLVPPFRLRKLPPSTTLAPSGETTRARTVWSGMFGAQEVRAPVVASAGAARVRPTLFTVVKVPPRYRALPRTAAARTGPFVWAVKPLLTAP